MQTAIVSNFTAENTGDDSLAFFKVSVSSVDTYPGIAFMSVFVFQGRSSVTDVHIKDAFARSILFFQSRDVSVTNATTVRSPSKHLEITLSLNMTI